MRYSRWNQQIEEGEERDQHLLLRVKHPRNLVPPPSLSRQFLWLRLERRRSAVLDKGISISSSSTRLLASARRWAPQRQQLLPLLPLLLLELLLERELVLLVLLVLVHLQVAQPWMLAQAAVVALAVAAAAAASGRRRKKLSPR
jgi:hypothetical protein